MIFILKQMADMTGLADRLLRDPATGASPKEVLPVFYPEHIDRTAKATDKTGRLRAASLPRVKREFQQMFQQAQGDILRFCAEHNPRPGPDRRGRRDKIRGCLIGGAVGDALGYPVEFLSWRDIQARYGREGIQSYDPDMETGCALISDDTQMTMFTANGLLVRDTRGHLRGIAGPAYCYVYDSYQDWLLTQTQQPRGEENHSWLLDIPERHSRRAPGGTCLSALSSKRCGTIDEPINGSKGCGGVMRVAPVGLFFAPDSGGFRREDIDRTGAEAAAITHGHSLGYIPAAVLTHIVNVGVYGGCPGETLCRTRWRTLWTRRSGCSAVIPTGEGCGR